MRITLAQQDGRMSDDEISDAVEHAVFTFRDDKDMSNRELLEGMLKCKYIDGLQYFRACTEKWQMLRLASVANYYIKNQNELWGYYKGKLPADRLLRLDGSGPISKRYLDLISKYTPMKNWIGSIQATYE